MRTLYGSARSRASRSLLALEELGLDFAHRPLRQWESEADMEAISVVNPNRRVPVLDDDGLVVWESMAINLYLADRYGGPLWPDDPAARARLYQWTIWSQTEIDQPTRHRARLTSDADARARAEAARLAALAILDGALADRPFLLGDTFALADLNVAATLSEPWEGGRVDGDLDPREHGLERLGAWLERCTSRASWARVRQLP